MPAYTYGDYVYFNNSTDAPKEHHNQLILNQEPDFYTTSLSNLMDETLTLLTKLFFNKRIKMDELSYQICGSVIKICETEYRKSTKRINVCGKRKRDKYFESCFFSKI